MQSERDNAGQKNNLYSINTNMEALQRLLSRFDGDGALPQASPALIRIAIDTARAEAQGFEKLLSTLLLDTEGVEPSVVEALVDIVARFKLMLDAQENALRDLDKAIDPDGR